MVEIILAVLIGILVVWMFWITRQSLQLEQVAQIMRTERDEYMRAIYFLTQKEFTITKEELQEIEATGQPLDSLLEELRQRKRK